MATLNDVAKRANVSKMTVSRVINHPEQVTGELKALVYKAMDELDYKPNRLAKALANQQTQMIKLYILEEMDTVEPYYMDLLTGIAKELDKHSYGLQLLTRDSQNLGESDGYIVCGAREADFARIDQLDGPVVIFGENAHGYDYVDSDNQGNIELTTKYAHQQGYDHLVYIEIDLDEPFARSRRQGYLNQVEKLHLEPRILSFPNDTDQVFEYLNNHLDDFKKSTAFICASDRLSLGVIRALGRSGRQIPEDYGIIGHDGVFLDQIAYPKLTTIRQDIKGMGEACARLLVEKIKSPKDEQEIIVYPSTLSVGGTTK